MISVCLATYNGSQFIKEQLESILNQIGPSDEVVITDDCSIDDTVSIIKNLNDERIFIFENERNSGVVKSFEKSIKNARNNFIFLSDQDDIWHKEKVDVMMSTFENDNEITLIYGNGNLVDENGQKLGRNLFKNEVSSSFIRHLIKPRFLGCSIAFKRNSVDKVFPFPKNIPMHDWWIGVNHIVYGKVHYLSKPLIDYRRHENTVTTGKNGPMHKMIFWRYKILSAFIINIFKSK